MATETTFIQFAEGSAPSTPDSTKWRAYFKTDGLYVIDDAGTETGPLAASVGGGAGPTSVTLGTDRTSTSTTLADVTGLSFALAANKTYDFEFFIRHTTAVQTTGINLVLNGPTVNYIAAFRTIPDNATTTQTFRISTYDPVNPTTQLAGPPANGAIAIIQGKLQTTASGTFIVRFASEVGGSQVTVFAGSSGRLWLLD